MLIYFISDLNMWRSSSLLMSLLMARILATRKIQKRMFWEQDWIQICSWLLSVGSQGAFKGEVQVTANVSQSFL